MLAADVKQAAEARARDQGYASLAAMLKVVATQAAHKAQAAGLVPAAITPTAAAQASPPFQASPPSQPMTAAEEAQAAQRRAWLKKREGLPTPDQVVSDNPHIYPEDLYNSDLELYKVFLDSGVLTRSLSK